MKKENTCTFHDVDKGDTKVTTSGSTQTQTKKKGDEHLSTSPVYQNEENHDSPER
jgi:hypothetical protein